MKISNHDAVLLTAAPLRIRFADPKRVGMKLQNNEATESIFYRSGGTGNEKSFLKLAPGQGVFDDINAPQQDLWAYASGAGAVLTLVEDFEVD